MIHCSIVNAPLLDRMSVLMEMPVGGRNGNSTAGITIEEVQAAIHRLTKNKAPGADNITAKEIQAAGNAGVELLL